MLSRLEIETTESVAQDPILLELRKTMHADYERMQPFDLHHLIMSLVPDPCDEAYLSNPIRQAEVSEALAVLRTKDSGLYDQFYY